jgi:hypothetical protein
MAGAADDIAGGETKRGSRAPHRVDAGGIEGHRRRIPDLVQMELDRRDAAARPLERLAQSAVHRIHHAAVGMAQVDRERDPARHGVA